MRVQYLLLSFSSICLYQRALSLSSRSCFRSPRGGDHGHSIPKWNPVWWDSLPHPARRLRCHWSVFYSYSCTQVPVALKTYWRIVDLRKMGDFESAYFLENMAPKFSILVLCLSWHFIQVLMLICCTYSSSLGTIWPFLLDFIASLSKMKPLCCVVLNVTL